MNVWQLIVTVFGGLSIFIYGMGLMSEGLTLIAGQRLKAALGLMTKNRVAAVWTDARLRGEHAKEALAILSIFNCLKDITRHLGNIAVRAAQFT